MRPAEPATTEATLLVKLIGRPTLLRGGVDLGSQIRYRKAFALLGYLVVHCGARQRREALADLLWPLLDTVAARANLRQALANLGAVLGPVPWLLRDRDSVGIEPHASWRADLLQVDADTTAAPPAGDLLEGLEFADAPAFEAWLIGARQHWRARVAARWRRLRQSCIDAGRPRDAIDPARRLVELDPLDESDAEVLASLLAAHDDPAGALATLGALRAALATELGTTPGPTLSALHARLAAQTVRRAAQAADGAAAELRWVSALYCDAGWRHDDPDSEDPQALPELHAALRQHGGSMLASTGRGVLAVFGLAGDAEGAARRALRAALELRGHAAVRAPRIGLVAGQTLCRHTGDGPRLIGELPELAMHIGWTAEPGEVLVDTRVAQQAEPGFALDDAGEHTFRGLQGVHRLYRLRGAAVSAGHTTIPAFVGRGAELDALLGLWRQVCAGQPRVALLRGAAGLGKTRLAYELARHVRDAGGAVEAIACRVETRHRLLVPVRDAVARHRALITTAADALGAQHAATLAALIDPAGDAAERLPAPKDAVFAAVLALFELHGASTPTLLLVDDLHWADPATAELVGMLARALSTRGLLLVTARPQGDAGLHARADAVVELQPLPPADTAALVAAVSAAQRIPLAQRHRIATASGGVPLFAERLARGWADGQHHLLPVHELLQAELDALGSDRDVLRAAAVLGEAFAADALRELAAPADVDAALVRATARGLVVRHGDDAHAFRHALIRDAAYDGLPHGRRRELHDAAARRLQRRADAAPEDIAHHYTAAARWPDAAPWWTRAAQMAASTGYAAHAVDCWTQAIDALTRAGHARQDLAVQQARLQLGFAAQMAQGYGSPLAYREFAALVDEWQARPSSPVQRAALFAALGGLFMGSSSQGAVDGVRTAQRLHELADSPAEALMAAFALGNALFWAGDFDAALRWQREGIALAAAVDVDARSRYSLDDPAVTCRAFAAWTLWFVGDADAAVAMADEAVALARGEQRVHALCFALLFATGVHWFRGDADAVARCAGECLELSRRYAFPLWEGASRLFLLWQQAASGELADAAALFDAAALLSTSYQGGVTTSRWIAARALLAHGAWREAAGLLERAVREAHLHEDQYCLADLLWLQAECLHREGRAADAATCRAQARALAHRHGARGLRLRFVRERALARRTRR